MRSIVYIGSDVHKSTFSLCALDGQTNQVLAETKCAAETKLIIKFINQVATSCPANTKFIVGYEAGCLGYYLCNELVKQGIECIILAPSTMYNTAKHKMVKNDKRDAKMIASNLANNTYHPVYVPDDEDVQVKEYIRMRKTFQKDFKRNKQALAALLLRSGFHYPGKTPWTLKYIDWIKGLTMPALTKDVVNEYLGKINDYIDTLERCDRTIEKLSHKERYEKRVQALQCLKGLSTTSAMTIHIEISDFSRFPTAKTFMSYIGLTPSEHSSGAHVSKGGLTKQGNSLVRSILIEDTHTLIKGQIGQKGKAVRKRQIGQPVPLINYADKASRRLQKRYYQLIQQGKPKNVAIAAVARELAGFIWGIETGTLD